MNYSEARRDAQQKADETGYDHGVAKDAFGEYGVRMLSRWEHRFGSDLRCEVVSCSTLANCKPGHGPMARGGR